MSSPDGKKRHVRIAGHARRAATVAAVGCAGLLTMIGAAPAEAKKLQLGVHATNDLSASEVQRMGQGDVGILRVVFRWSAVEPQPGLYNWDRLDALMKATGREKLDVLPVLVGTPDWAKDDPAAGETEGKEAWPVTNTVGAEHARLFIGKVAERYGRDGTFWADNPDVRYEPIKDYQIWNEPNRKLFSPGGRPKPLLYARFLKSSSRAIKAFDPKANILMAGMPQRFSTGRPLDSYLREFYKIKHVKQAFDTMTLHPYSTNVKGIEFSIEQMRELLRNVGDKNRELWITEFGWGSGGDSEFFSKSPKTQARLLTESFKLMRNRRDKYDLGAAIWFSWRDRPRPAGGSNPWQVHTGLFKQAGGQKPAWAAFTDLTGGDAGSGPLEDPLGLPLMGRELPLLPDGILPAETGA